MHDVPDTSTGPWMGFFGFNVMLRPPLDTLPCPSPSGHVPGISEWGGHNVQIIVFILRRPILLGRVNNIKSSKAKPVAV